MSVGLYDVDFFKYHQVMFNLEIMKMATYFKNKGEITVLSPTYSPDRYTNFYLRKDFYDGSFPPSLHKYDNLVYGGLAFSRTKYEPLAAEIERCAPDTFVYEKYKNLFIEDSKTNKSAYSSLVNNIHLRLSLDGQTIWKFFERQIPLGKKANILFFHDLNLAGIEGARQLIPELLHKYSRQSDVSCSIANKFPIVCNGLDDYQLWNQFTFNTYFSLFQINGPVSDEELSDIVTSTNQTKLSRIKYQIADASSSKNHFLDVVLPKIFKQVIFLCRNKKQILLNIADDFVVNEELRDLITLLNSYMGAATSYVNGTLPALYIFCKHLKEQNSMYRTHTISKERAKEIFFYIAKVQPELFKMFYECNQVKLIGGEFQ